MALPTSHNVVTAAQLGSTLSSYNTKLNARFKPKQTAVEDPTASGTTTTAIDSISQDANGVITVTKKTISGITPASHTHGNLTNDGKVGSAADYAVVTTTGGAITATSLATSAPSASGNALAFIDSVSQNSKGKITATKKSVTVDSTYSATGTNPVNGKAIAAAIGTLDVSAIAGSASKTLTSISETDGKISATYSDIAIAQSQVSGLATALNAKAPLASPALTGTPTAPTADAGTDTTQIATTAFVKAEINSVLDAADAMQFKGTIGSSGATVTALPDTHKAGWTYKVAEAGTYAGKACEVGDMIICVKDGTAAADADWTIVQNNIDGAVTGPASSVDARVAVFNGTTGKVIKDSGFTIGKSVPSNAVFTDTDTKVTSASNHYTPSRDTSADKSASASGATAAWSIDVVKGVTLQTDGKGHVTGVAVTSGKIPANPNTDTKVTSAANHYAPETASGSEIAASASGADAAWSIDVVKGVSLNTDGKGHVTGISVTSGKIPSNPNTDTKVKATAKTDNVNYKILATASASPTSGNATEAVYDADITLNPSTNTIAANISGDAATASAAKSGSALETAINGKAASGHTHDIALATDSGTATVTLAHNTTYKLTAGGKSVIFKTPTDNNSDTKVTQTLVASDNTSEYPILLAPTGQTATATTTSNFVTGAKYKPSTNTLSVNVSGSSASCSGNAATASAAKSGSALETAINGKVSTSTTVNGHALSGNVTVTAADVSAVRYDTNAQGLSDTQKSNARTNIGAGTSNLALGTSATTAAKGNHTHATSIATSTGTSSIELTPGGKYSISAGGTTCIFQNGTEMTDQEVTDLLDALT